jgi:hypothetical protein
MEQVIYLSMVTACLSYTVTETRFFEPVRKLVKEVPFFGKLLSCGYCLGHWIAFVLTAIYLPRLFSFWWPLDYFLTAVAVAWLAGVQWGIMSLIMLKADK